MSDLLYHKELNDAQWNRVKYLFEEPKRVGRPPLNPRMVLTGFCGYCAREPVGEIYQPVKHLSQIPPLVQARFV